MLAAARPEGWDAALRLLAAALPDGDLSTVAVSRGGTRCAGIDAVFDPADLLAAWPSA